MGLLLRAVKAQGWDPESDVNIITQAPEVAGSALQANKIEAHADFVPFAELFPWRGFARKIYDGSQANAPTFHGTLVDAAYAEKYPEIVIAYLRAALEADRLIAAEPEKYSGADREGDRHRGRGDLPVPRSRLASRPATSPGSRNTGRRSRPRSKR